MVKLNLTGILTTLLTTLIVGGFVWVQEIGTRLALVEDDLGETVDVISLLHPPQRAELLQEQVFHTSDKHEQRRSKLEQLKQQCEEPPPVGDDDDSSAPLNS
jgi:hypothetical protein